MDHPKLLRNVRLDEFQATFSFARYDSNQTYMYFAFNAKDQNHYNRVLIYHYNTPTAPKGYEVIDGGVQSAVDYTTRDATGGRVPALGPSDILWVRVECEYNVVKIWCKANGDASSGWPEAGDYCFRSSDFDTDGGMLGFFSGSGYVDDLTIKRSDGAGGWESTAEIVEDFEVDANGRATDPLAHDAAGNLTYDGKYEYTYDAWNRLATVTRAWDGGGSGKQGATIATMVYDGTGRRISKTVEYSGDWDFTYHFYYNGQSEIEIRNGDSYNEGSVLKQKVWGTQYVDELVQIAINQDPSNNSATYSPNDENVCERFFWVCQDANYNVIGVVSAAGVLTERYEYTPYGQRTIFSRGWLLADLDDDGVVGSSDLTFMSSEMPSGAPDSRADLDGDGDVDSADGNLFMNYYYGYLGDTAIAKDPLVMHPRLESFRSPVDGGGGISLCDIGHQGLMHDKEFGLIYNRARYLNAILGRPISRDREGYIEGMNLYEYCRSEPVGRVDWMGLESQPTQPSKPQKGDFEKMSPYSEERLAAVRKYYREMAKYKQDMLKYASDLKKWDAALEAAKKKAKPADVSVGIPRAVVEIAKALANKPLPHRPTKFGSKMPKNHPKPGVPNLGKRPGISAPLRNTGQKTAYNLQTGRAHNVHGKSNAMVSQQNLRNNSLKNNAPTKPKPPKNILSRKVPRVTPMGPVVDVAKATMGAVVSELANIDCSACGRWWNESLRGLALAEGGNKMYCERIKSGTKKRFCSDSLRGHGKSSAGAFSAGALIAGFDVSTMKIRDNCLRIARKAKKLRQAEQGGKAE